VQDIKNCSKRCQNQVAVCVAFFRKLQQTSYLAN